MRFVSDTPKKFNAFLSLKFLNSSVLNDELLLLLCKLSGFQEGHILSLAWFIVKISLVEHCGSGVIIALH
jgi:hypothetical protein